MIHLVLAKKGTEAGDYYNYPSIKFVKSKFTAQTQKFKINFFDKFMKFLTTEIPKFVIDKENNEKNEFEFKIEDHKEEVVDNKENSMQVIKIIKCSNFDKLVSQLEVQKNEQNN